MKIPKASNALLIVSVLFLTLSSTAQALTYQEIYQYQTSGKVLGAATPALLNTISSNVETNSNSSLTLTVPATSAGSLLVAWISSGSTLVGSTVSDASNGTWATAITPGPICSLYGSYNCGAYYFCNSAAGVTNITLHAPGQGFNNNSIIYGEYSGIAASSCLDQASSLGSWASGGAWSSPSVTINQPDLLVAPVWAGDSSATLTGANGFTNEASIQASGQFGIGLEDQAVSSITSYTAQGISSSGGAQGAILAFKQIYSGPLDTTPPSTPTGLSATAVSSSALNLTWNVSTDNIAVIGYKIFRNGTQIGTSAINSYSDTGLLALTQYTYTVSAYDNAGNNSSQSGSASATTLSGSVGSGTNIYIAQSGAGNQGAASCANAKPVSFFNTPSNWAATQTTGSISPGTTVHLCGVISTQLSVQGSGIAGNPIYILFEPNAKLSQPAGTLMSVQGQSYITIDGGTNGILENTDNGTAGDINPNTGKPYGNQIATGGIYAPGVSNFEVKNLTIQNLYVHSSDANGLADGGIDFTVTAAIYLNGIGSNVSIHNNTIHDTQSVVESGGAANESGFYFYNNNLYNYDHGIVGIGGSAVVPANINIYNNHFGTTANWDTAANSYHHDGIYVYFSPGTTLSGVNIYNNLFDGNWGNNNTGYIALWGAWSGPGGLSNFNVYNNVFIQNPNNYINDGLLSGGGLNFNIYNNTFLGSSVYNSACASIGSTGGLNFENNILSGCSTFLTNPGAGNVGVFDYNLYANQAQGGNPVWGYQADPEIGPINTFSLWKQFTGFDSHSSYVANAGLNSGGVPQAGSAAIVAGANLSTLAVGNLSSLLSDTGTGNTHVPIARPSAAPWDIGAYQYSSGGSQPSPDTTPPSTPTGLTATAISASAMNLSWTASSDNVGVTGYNIYRKGTQVGTSVNTSYTDTGLSANTLYNYTVSAYDAAGNNSSQSSSAQATTTTLLPIISNLVGSNTTATTSQVSWSTNVLTNGLVAYGLTSSYGASSTLLDTNPLTTSHNITLINLVPSTLYHFKVTSIDALGNTDSSSDFSFATLSLPTVSTTTPTSTPVSSGGGYSPNPPSGGGGGSYSPVVVYIPPAAPSPVSPEQPLTPTPSSGYKLINSSGTLYLIENGLRHGITNPGMLASYGFSFGQAQTATAQDLSLPQGSILTPANGSLVKSPQDQTVYLISGQTRYAFTSGSVFLALGFKFSSVLTVTNPELQELPRGNDLNNGGAQHLPGTDINRSNTIYWVGADRQLHGYPSLNVYNSWHLANNFSTVAPANSADLSLPVGALEQDRVVE